MILPAVLVCHSRKLQALPVLEADTSVVSPGLTTFQNCDLERNQVPAAYAACRMQLHDLSCRSGPWEGWKNQPDGWGLSLWEVYWHCDCLQSDKMIHKAFPAVLYLTPHVNKLV